MITTLGKASSETKATVPSPIVFNDPLPLVAPKSFAAGSGIR